MSEFSRILTNLGLAYGLMTKDQFVDLVAKYAQEKNLSEEKMSAIVEHLFEELEITYKRRQANQMFDAYKKRKVSESPDISALFDEMMGTAASGDEPSQNTVDILTEMKALRKSIEALTDHLKSNHPTE